MIWAEGDEDRTAHSLGKTHWWWSHSFKEWHRVTLISVISTNVRTVSTNTGPPWGSWVNGGLLGDLTTWQTGEWAAVSYTTLCLQGTQTLLRTLRAERVATNWLLWTTMAHSPGQRRAQIPLEVCSSPTTQMVCQVHMCAEIGVSRILSLTPGKLRSKDSLQCPQIYPGDRNGRT